MLCSKQQAYTENFTGSVFNHLCAPKSSFIAHTYKLGGLSIFCEQCFLLLRSKINFHDIRARLLMFQHIVLWLECDLTSGHLANVGISFTIPRDTIKEASIHGYFRPFVVHTWLRISPFRNIQLFSTLPYPNPVFLLQTNEPRISSRSIPSTTLLNLMIDKLPFFLSLDGD